MVNLEKMRTTTFVGEILTVEEKPLREFLGDKVDAFKQGMTRFPKNIQTQLEKEQYKEDRLDANVLVVTYGVTANDNEYTNSEFFTIPSVFGWGRSKLKALREKNDLPNDTNQWVGKDVKVLINNDGYLRLLE